MNKILILSFFSVISALAVGDNLKNLDEILDHSVKLVRELDEQPIFTGAGIYERPSKILPWNNWDDCRIIEIFQKNAIDYLPDGYPKYIQNKEALFVNGKHIQALILILKYTIGDKPVQKISEKIIREAYGQVLNTLSNGWSQTTVAQQPDIFHEEDEKEWYLFKKKSSLKEEAVLIRFLAHRLGLSDSVYSSNDKIIQGHLKPSDTVYLWIKKDGFTKFLEAFNTFDIALLSR